MLPESTFSFSRYCATCMQEYYPGLEEVNCPHKLIAPAAFEVLSFPVSRQESAAERQAREIIERLQFS